MEFKHIPVMLDECIGALNIRPNGVYIDCTLGGGGHSSVIASRLNEAGTLYCFDLDSEAIAFAKTKVQSRGRVEFVHDNFKNFMQHIDAVHKGKIDGILVDLGVSSYQIDNPERGFSYINDGPLNMCMDASSEHNAEYVVNEYLEDDLVRIFRDYGEEKFARQIAKNIVASRKTQRITTTAELAGIVERSIPAKFRFANGHPAKRVFQAIRIEVNGELAGLNEFLISCVRDGLGAGGRLAVITFHSLEDRIAKDAFKMLSSDCLCDKRIPVCVCHHSAEVRLLSKKPILPSDAELAVNSRSHSAKLRVIEKI